MLVRNSVNRERLWVQNHHDVVTLTTQPKLTYQIAEKEHKILSYGETTFLQCWKNVRIK